MVIPALTVTFVLLIHHRWIDRSLWFDEAAVVDNAATFEIKSVPWTTNWLQSAQPGFSIIVKGFLLLPNGVVLIKATMLVCLSAALVIIQSILRKYTQSYLVLLAVPFLIALSSFSLQYSTSVKPYVLDLLGTALLAYAIVFRHDLLHALVTIVAPLVTSTFLPLSVAAVLFRLFRTRKSIDLAVAVTVFVNGVALVFLQDLRIARLLRDIWFGDTQRLSFSNVKGTAYQYFGVLAEAIDGADRSIFVRRSQVGLLVILFILVIRTIRNADGHFESGLQHLFELTVVYSALILVLQLVGINPLALRLNSPLLVLILIVTFLTLQEFSYRLVRYLAVLSFLLSTASLKTFVPARSGVIDLFRTETIDVRHSFYTDIWSGPASAISLRQLGGSIDNLYPTIGQAQSSTVTFCPQLKYFPKEGDYLIFDIDRAVLLTLTEEASGLDLIDYIDGTGLFQVSRQTIFRRSAEMRDEVYCRYWSENPEIEFSSKLQN